MSRTHELKSWPEFYAPTASGEKPFDVRKNDRDFQPGDHLVLKEWEPRGQAYTGQETRKLVTFVLTGVGVGGIEPLRGLSVGYAVLGLAPA